MPEQSQQKPPDMREIMADYDKAMDFFSSMPAEAWESLGIKTALNVFGEAKQKIPAYKEFTNGFSNIDSIEKFNKLPLIDKHNYIEANNFNEVNLAKAGTNLYSFSLSSGTVDKPTVWPRDYQYEEFLPLVLEKFFRMNWQIEKKSTFLIVALTLGSWTAGFLIFCGVRPLTQKYNLTLVTCGSDLENIIFCIKKFSHLYDQTVIISYTTFARTILERLERDKVSIRKLNLKLMIGGEGHPVEWREYVNKLISGDPENLTSIFDTYGTSDSGMLGFSMPLTALIRHLAQKNLEMRKELFGRVDCVPTLMQYNTSAAYLEEIGGEIIITSKNTIPLVRYNIHDRGGLIRFRDMERILKKYGYDYKKILEKKGFTKKFIWQQPFVYIFGRGEDTVSVAAAKVYPEQIAPALLNEHQEVHDFKLIATYDDKMRQMFKVFVELKDGVKQNLLEKARKKKIYHNLIVKQLLKTNIDYADAFKLDRKVADPKVEIYAKGQGPFAKEVKNIKPRLVVR